MSRYTEATSPWTLDYPPFFAWFEYLLSLAARHVDPAMLQIDNLDYASWRTVLFQRFTVIITDLVLFLGCKSLAEALPKGQGGRHSRASTLTLLIMTNAGLLMVDHVHFQYNGLLTGVLLLTIASLARDRVVSGAVWFSVLLHMKHIYLYYAPAVGIYMLRSHCFQSTREGRIVWRSFSLFRLLSLAVVVLATSALSLVPFIQVWKITCLSDHLTHFLIRNTSSGWSITTHALSPVSLQKRTLPCLLGAQLLGSLQRGRQGAGRDRQAARQVAHGCCHGKYDWRPCTGHQPHRPPLRATLCHSRNLSPRHHARLGQALALPALPHLLPPRPHPLRVVLLHVRLACAREGNPLGGCAPCSLGHCEQDGG